MKTLLHAIPLAGCLTFLQQAPSAHAQTLSTSFTVIGVTGKIDGLSYGEGSRKTALEIPAFVRSKTYRYSGPAQMGLFSSQVSKSTNEPVAGVVLEAGVPRYTILVGAENGKYRALAIPNDTTRFPLGTARMVNLCGIPLSVRCNQAQTVVIPPHKNVTVRPRPDNLLVTESSYQQPDGKVTRLNDDFVPVPPDQQTSIFFLTSDSDFFKSADGVTVRKVQMVVLRENPNAPVEPSSPQPVEEELGEDETPKDSKTSG